jgi:transcriptional regulator with XRE-family HTH domain
VELLAICATVPVVNPRERLARNIKTQRLNRDMGQEELAQACEVDPTEISRPERNARDPRFTTIVRVAQAMRVKPPDLMNGIR